MEDESEYANLILILGNEEESRSVWGVFPRDRAKELVPVLQRSMMSVEMIDRPSRPVAGSEIRMIPPAGSLPAEGFIGYQDEFGSGMINITTFPGSFEEARPQFSKEAFVAKEIAVTEHTPVKVGDLDGLFLAATHDTPDGRAGKYMLIFGDDSRVFVIVAGWLLEEDARFRKALLRSIRSARAGEMAGDPRDVLRFEIDEVPPLKFAQVVATGAMYAEDGVLPLRKPGDPSYGVLLIPSKEDMSELDLDTAMKLIVSREKSLTGAKLVSSRSFRLAGVDACEGVVHGTDADSGEKHTLYLVIRPCEEGFYMVRATVIQSREDEILPVFRKMTASFRLK
jgi:hypothetical protein